MRRIGFALVLCALAALAAGPSLAADKDDVLTVVQRFVTAFNAGDLKTAQEVSVDDLSIIDEFPPYEWHGPGTMAKWVADYDTDSKMKGISEGKVTLGKAKHVEVVADRAYVVAPADYAYMQNGKKVKQKGSTFTAALAKSEGVWKITGWSWGRN